MKVSLSFTDIQHAMQEFQQQAGGRCQLSPKETAFLLPPTLGQGYLRGISLRDGLDLFIHEFTLKEDLVLDFRKLSAQQSLVDFTFCLSGKTTSSIPGIKSKFDVVAGQTTFAIIPQTAGISELTAGQKNIVIGLGVAPTLLLTLLENDLHKFPTDWQRRLQNAAFTPYFQPNCTTPKVAHILQLILYCPHRGGTRRLYLEAKALELIALCLDQLTPCAADNSPLDWVNSKDIDALHRAKDILFQSIPNPPSLDELTQQVGISEHKLQRGFKQIFGTTVFGLLHDYRMEQARQLLEVNQMTIEEIANMVGISHRGYFARAFKRKFGVTPREYVKRLEL